MENEETIPATRRFLPVLLLLFVGSGCAALIYEVVWFQLLEFVIGASSLSLGVLLGTFMGGMCVGSYMLPRLISKHIHPLRVYALLELGIGAMGLLILIAMKLNLISGIYSMFHVTGVFSIVIRCIIAMVCLLPPTILMGATLPAIARWVETTPQGVSWMGFFYGGNIAGAVLGSLLAGFGPGVDAIENGLAKIILFPFSDLNRSTFTAVAINVGVAVLALSIARRAPFTSQRSETRAAQRAPGAWEVYVVIALSGMTALACEVIWTRLLSLLFGATVYAFALILAVFLSGLGIGSSIGSSLAAKVARPRLVLGLCQMLLCAAMAWSAYQLLVSMWSMPIDPTLKITSPMVKFQLDMMRALWAVLPGSILWGASFPLALASVAAKNQDPARLVGGVYAANTVGAIVGAMSASFFMVSTIGTQRSLQILMVVSALAGLFAAVPVLFDTNSGNRPRFAMLTVMLLIIGAACAGVLASGVPELPARFVQYGRFAATRGEENKTIYVGEGMNAFVSVSEMPDGTRNYHNAGKVQASSHPADMKLQRMLGHLTTLAPKNQTNQHHLVIGFGAGVTAGAVSIGPEVELVTIADIEPLVPKVVGEHFGKHNYNVAHRTEPGRKSTVDIHIDDGRHFLSTTTQKFDGITSDPLDPWVKGAAALYTEEFFELAKSRLTDGGVVTQFVQMYESTEDSVKSEIATFFKVFPNAIVWANTINGQGYDLVLFGQKDPTHIDVDEWNARLLKPEYAQLSQSLREIGVLDATQLLGTFAGMNSDLTPWFGPNPPINTDTNLKLQYLAGMGLNLYEAAPILEHMTVPLKYPEGLFTCSPAVCDQLRQAIVPKH